MLGGLGAERRVARGDGRLGGQAERPLLRRTTHSSSVGTLVVGDARLRLVAKAGRRDFAATCAADAAFLAQIEAWPEERLRAMHDCLGAHDQQLVSVVRQRRNADKQWGAVVAREAERKRKRDEEHAAAAPARAAALARAREREEGRPRARAASDARVTPDARLCESPSRPCGGEGRWACTVPTAPAEPAFPERRRRRRRACGCG